MLLICHAVMFASKEVVNVRLKSGSGAGMGSRGCVSQNTQGIESGQAYHDFPLMEHDSISASRALRQGGLRLLVQCTFVPEDTTAECGLKRKVIS
jgi:hypothetical protein